MRLPDGSCKTHHFPAQSPLSDLYSFVRTDTNYTSFSLSTSFPRRNLDTEDKAATLKDLQMAPSCTVMVLPSSTLASHNGDFMSLIWLLLTPLTLLLSFTQVNGLLDIQQGHVNAETVFRLRFPTARHGGQE